MTSTLNLTQEELALIIIAIRGYSSLARITPHQNRATLAVLSAEFGIDNAEDVLDKSEEFKGLWLSDRFNPLERKLSNIVDKTFV